MPTSIATIQIKAPAAHVYRYISTPHLLPEWVDGLDPEKLAGGDSEIKLGMRAPDHGPSTSSSSDYDLEMVTFSPDYSASMRIESAGFIMQTKFYLFESDESTVVRQHVKLSYKRWFKLFAMITNRSVQRKIEENLERLKLLVEPESKASAEAA